jgi:serine/threonine protein kinase
MKDEARLLFHELADLPVDDRERLLAERQIGPELRAEVESLLSLDSSKSQSLTDCVANVADEVLHSEHGCELGNCGLYRLVRLLGRGGMGTVYLGERADGEIQQKVAVKLLSSHRPGWRNRFLKERQLLASLNHPSIVHTIDAGHTEDGRPYLVIEYVDGIPLDVYASRIGPRDRLMLFLRVCEPVSHAHRHLIIHRDLKPSNILVDASGLPKLLDFGIAKLLDETEDPTQTVERLLTPNYASPEQIRGGIQTTATDIYSLGAILYKLLTGRTPRQQGIGVSPSRGVIDTTREVAPPRRLNPNVPLDVSYIVMKAIRTEPEERYASVEAFEADIRAYLESRPVIARSGNVWYRTRKFLQRYWMPVSAAALVILSLSIGMYVANRERTVAERRFQQLRQLSNRVFDLDKAILKLPGALDARRRLVAASLEYLEGLASSAQGDLDLAEEIASAYERAASIEGVPTEFNLGDFGKAEQILQKADGLIDRVLESRPRRSTALLTSAQISHDRMILAEEEKRRTDALTHAQKATERLKALLKQTDLLEKQRFNAAGLYSNLAVVHSNMHLYDEAISDLDRTLEIARPIPSAQRHVIFALTQMSQALRYKGDLAGALQTIREAEEIADRTALDGLLRAVTLGAVLTTKGRLLGEDGGVNLGRPEEATNVLERAFEMFEQLAAAQPNDYGSRSREAEIGGLLANILRHIDPQRALKVYDLSTQRLSETPSNVTAFRDRAKLLAESSYALMGVPRGAEAKQRIDSALEILTTTKDYPTERVKLGSEVYVALTALGDFYVQRGDTRRSLATFEQLYDRVMAGKPEHLTDLRDAPKMSKLYDALGCLYRATGDAAKSAEVAAMRRELWSQWDRKLPDNSFIRRQIQAVSCP